MAERRSNPDEGTSGAGALPDAGARERNTSESTIIPVTRAFLIPTPGTESGPDKPDLGDSVQHSQEALIEMLKDRFERVVDALVRSRLSTREDWQAELDILFELYDDGLLTKGEVRRRSHLEPEDFYSELRAHRVRTSSR